MFVPVLAVHVLDNLPKHFIAVPAKNNGLSIRLGKTPTPASAVDEDITPSRCDITPAVDGSVDFVGRIIVLVGRIIVFVPRVGDLDDLGDRAEKILRARSTLLRK